MIKTDSGRANTSSSRRNRLTRRIIISAGILALAAISYAEARSYELGRELVRKNPDSIPADATLLSYANGLGRSTYETNCASCHGAELKGDSAKGVPNLSDAVWLYDYGRISDIERTVLYGIRSGDARSHNVTDMPAVGLQKTLTPDEIKDVIAFVRSLNKRSEDTAAVMRGEAIFEDKGVCYDCHARDGDGISDYGAPNLADDEWLFGGDDASIYKSIYDGRHGKCPAFIAKLSFPAIRAVAVYVHSMSQESADSPNRALNETKDAPHG